MEGKFNLIQELCPGFDFWELYYDSLRCQNYSINSSVSCNNNIKYHPLMDFTIRKTKHLLICNAETYSEEPEKLVYQEGIMDLINPSFGLDFGITSIVDYFIDKLRYIKDCKEYALHKLGDVQNYRTVILDRRSNIIEGIYEGLDAYQVFIGICYLKQGFRRSFRYYDYSKPSLDKSSNIYNSIYPHIIGLEEYFTIDK